MKPYGTKEVKKDCFAYKEAMDPKKLGSCLALTELFCKKEICSFYKNKETTK